MSITAEEQWDLFLKFVQTPYVPACDGNNWLVHTQQDYKTHPQWLGRKQWMDEGRPVHLLYASSSWSEHKSELSNASFREKFESADVIKVQPSYCVQAEMIQVTCTIVSASVVQVVLTFMMQDFFTCIMYENKCCCSLLM